MRDESASVCFFGVGREEYDDDEILLGRDALNKLWVLLDRPAQTSEVL